MCLITGEVATPKEPDGAAAKPQGRLGGCPGK